MYTWAKIVCVNNINVFHRIILLGILRILPITLLLTRILSHHTLDDVNSSSSSRWPPRSLTSNHTYAGIDDEVLGAALKQALSQQQLHFYPPTPPFLQTDLVYGLVCTCQEIKIRIFHRVLDVKWLLFTGIHRRVAVEKIKMYHELYLSQKVDDIHEHTGAY